MEFLIRAYEIICQKNVQALMTLVKKNTDTAVLPTEFEAFTQMFANEEKEQINGSVNIHGMGGSGFPKANITSLACLYLSAITKLPIVKTGSRKNTGVMGSTDFFEEIGFMNIRDRKSVLEEYGFTYFDYLELSPWKAYKDILRLNSDISVILNGYHFFEYKIGTLGLGISSKKMHSYFLSQCHFPAPDRIFTYCSEVNGMLLDEISPSGYEYPFTKALTLREVSVLNHALAYGDDTESYWYHALRESVATFAVELNVAECCEDGREKFDKAYTDRYVAKMLKKVIGEK